MDAIQRVEKMEAILNEQLSLTAALENLLEQVEKAQPAFQELLDYYQSPVYMDDFDRSNRGEFDQISCGVLSEDGVYNLLYDRHNLAQWMKELGEGMGADR